MKVNFVSKLDINQKSESKDPHWQSISSELFEKTPATQGLVFPLLVLSLLTLPNQNHSPPPSLSPTILSFLCSSSVPSTFLLSRRCPPGYPQPPPNEEGVVAPADLAAFKLRVNGLQNKDASTLVMKKALMMVAPSPSWL